MHQEKDSTGNIMLISKGLNGHPSTTFDASHTFPLATIHSVPLSASP